MNPNSVATCAVPQNMLLKLKRRLLTNPTTFSVITPNIAPAMHQTVACASHDNISNMLLATFGANSEIKSPKHAPRINGDQGRKYHHLSCLPLGFFRSPLIPAL